MGIIIFIVLLVISVSVYDYYDSRNWQSTTSISRNSVIFEHRNKKYGAYHLRRDYNDSLGIIIGLLVLFIAIISIINVSIRTAPEKLEIPVIIDTIAMTITAPPVEEIKTLKTPFKVVGGGSGREGKPSNDPVKPPTPQTAKVSTVDKSDVHTNSGNSKRTNADNKTNAASSLKKADDELAYGGGGKKNDGTGKFGNDDGYTSGKNGKDGEGYDKGSGGVVKRSIATDIPNDEIESNVNGYLYFKLSVNADGDVVAVVNDSKRTTITDAAFVSRIMNLVKKYVKYNKRSPGSAIEQITYAKKVNAT